MIVAFAIDASRAFLWLASYNKRKRDNCECGYDPTILEIVGVKSFYRIKLERREKGIGRWCGMSEPRWVYVVQQAVVYTSLKQ